jgi:two-component system CheB/CheR fusion protein
MAREGRYPAAIENDISAERLRRFFVREGESYRVRQELRDIVLFAAHDLVKDPPFSHVDLVTCRNVLIYLDRELQEQVCGTFHYALRPGGYLMLGAS